METAACYCLKLLSSQNDFEVVFIFLCSIHIVLRERKVYIFFPICLTCSYCTQQWNKWRKKSEDSKEY